MGNHGGMIGGTMPQMTDERVRAGIPHVDNLSLLKTAGIKTPLVSNIVVDILDSDGTFSKEKGDYQ